MNKTQLLLIEEFELTDFIAKKYTWLTVEELKYAIEKVWKFYRIELSYPKDSAKYEVMQYLLQLAKIRVRIFESTLTLFI